ncbi:MAG: hypothetical protein ACOYJE_05015 [Bacteroidaceae bacterium]|jgi:hypothetical protein
MNEIASVPSLFPSRPALRRLRRGLLSLLLAGGLAACSGDDEPVLPPAADEDLQEVTLYLSLPAPADSVSKRLGDPGSAHEETDDWNTLVLFIVYENPEGEQKEVRCETLTQEEYDALQPMAPRSPFKRYTLTAPAGTVYFYGLTYYDPEAAETAMTGATDLKKAIGQCTTQADVEALTISNYYPYAVGATQTDVSKFCSVASGYYQDENGGFTYEINYSNIPTEPNEIPTLTLRRLAAKIDVQWDAEGAYSGGKYTDARVESFQFYGSAEGKVFPELPQSGYTPVEKDWDFYNISPISQRNGRVYHYTFPDGTTKPQVTFSITTTTATSETTTKRDYTLNWQQPLSRATWYKVNATVNGNSSSGTISDSEWVDINAGN